MTNTTMATIQQHLYNHRARVKATWDIASGRYLVQEHQRDGWAALAHHTRQDCTLAHACRVLAHQLGDSAPRVGGRALVSIARESIDTSGEPCGCSSAAGGGA